MAELALDVVVLVRVLAHLHELALHVVQVHRGPVGGHAGGGRYLGEREEGGNHRDRNLATLWNL